MDVLDEHDCGPLADDVGQKLCPRVLEAIARGERVQVAGDVEAGQISVARGRQRNIDGWVAKARAGTRTAQAALDGRAALDGQAAARHTEPIEGQDQA